MYHTLDRGLIGVDALQPRCGYLPSDRVIAAMKFEVRDIVQKSAELHNKQVGAFFFFRDGRSIVQYALNVPPIMPRPFFSNISRRWFLVCLRIKDFFMAMLR